MLSPMFAQELKRKLFHGLSLVYLAIYLVAGRAWTLWILGGLFAMVGAIEAVRLRKPEFNALLLRVFGGIHREHEARKPSGILWTLLGCFLTVWLVPHKDVVITALVCLALGDAAASLVGRRWGHLRYGNKSLEGSLACFLTCWAVATLFLHSPFATQEILLVAMLVTVAEAVPLPLNDNIWIPLIPGLTLTFLRAARLQ